MSSSDRCWRCQGRGEYPVSRYDRDAWWFRVFMKACDCGAKVQTENEGRK